MITESMSHGSPPSGDQSVGPGPTSRARRILGANLRYIDHPSFADPAAPDLILAEPRAADWGTDPVPADDSDATLLSRDQEAHLFRRMNYLKSRACRLREHLDPGHPSPVDLEEIERLISEAAAMRKRIVEMNLRLVVSIARTRVSFSYRLPECVSDGNLALIRAVDGFDFARGNKFSSYATRAIQHQLARNKRRSIRRLGQSLVPYEETLTAPEPDIDEQDREEVRDRMTSAVRRWLGRLDERERRVLASHYGLDGTPKQTLEQIGRDFGISKERVRQIEDRALAKLREGARLEGLEAPMI